MVHVIWPIWPKCHLADEKIISVGQWEADVSWPMKIWYKMANQLISFGQWDLFVTISFIVFQYVDKWKSCLFLSHLLIILSCQFTQFQTFEHLFYIFQIHPINILDTNLQIYIHTFYWLNLSSLSFIRKGKRILDKIREK